MPKFGVGQAATRYEDDRLLSGQGSYVEDLNLDNQTHAVFVRSPHAHARILGIEVSTFTHLSPSLKLRASSCSTGTRENMRRNRRGSPSLSTSLTSVDSIRVCWTTTSQGRTR